MVMLDDDDDVEPQLTALENYYLLDSKKQPVCFSTLPLRLGDAGDDDVSHFKKRLVLWGTADPGIKKYKEVVSWKVGFEGKQPEIAVLAADGGWISLVKPLYSYMETIRTILITVQMLHFLRRKPDEPEKSLWSHLRKVFDKFDVRPSVDDLRNHRSLIKQFAEKDPTLAKSEVGADNIELKQPFIADDEEIDEMVTDDNNESDEEDDEDLFDSICAICDNGGDLLCCDGPCMRSFHAKEGTGEDSYCVTLGYTEAEVQAMKIFLCENCKYKQHQCYICGALEPSDGAAAKVWRTEHKSLCNLLFADAVQGHTTENVCQDNEDEDIITRAWELPKRILIYCLDHEIDPDIDTPVRDHIKFPKVKKPVGFLKNRVNLLAEKKTRTYDESFLDQPSKEPAKVTGRVHVQERKQTIRKLSVNISSDDFLDEPEKKRTRFLKQKILPEPQVAKDASLSSPKPVQEQEQQMVPLPSSDTRKIPPSSFPVVDSETEKRVITLLGNKVSSLTIKDVTRKCSVPSTHVYSGRQTDRIIAQGKLERSVQAVEAALRKLENGGNVDDAKAVCEPDVLKQLARWHNHFCFEKRDWMTVQPNELPHGSQLSPLGPRGFPLLLNPSLAAAAPDLLFHGRHCPRRSRPRPNRAADVTATKAQEDVVTKEDVAKKQALAPWRSPRARACAAAAFFKQERAPRRLRRRRPKPPTDARRLLMTMTWPSSRRPSSPTSTHRLPAPEHPALLCRLSWTPHSSQFHKWRGHMLLTLRHYALTDHILNDAAFPTSCPGFAWTALWCCGSSTLSPPS
ncbi:hypothetical protein PR202_ga16848 [Eleusine coracana subsp. coracana]|uniref:RFTS domain-containing protein n=1 Tax=Eleusine coracana subsp. coracana TaxID=191504 RepID=A0AAV5CNX3_ELECO|nr:hypothetical protein PR202_ga16848 [Eleusine coracana subsp. coracana]